MKTSKKRLLALPILLLAALGALGSVSGCASTRGRADDLMSHGKYLEAADLYDRVVLAHPDDKEARELRDLARERALKVKLEDAQKKRAANATPEWLVAVDGLLAKRTEWSFRSNAELERGVLAEIEALASYTRNMVAELLRGSQPLLAEETLKTMVPLRHPELGKVRTEQLAEVNRGGRTKCERFSESVVAETAYWGYVVGQYCLHWGGALATRVPVPPHTRSGVRIEGALEGINEGQSAALRSEIATAFTKSRWFDAQSEVGATGALNGRNVTQITSRKVAFDKPWVEQVPYQATESYNEPFEETYMATETYSESVQYRDYENEPYECGTLSRPKTCNRRRMVMRTREEPRTRQVTRTRTSSRPATRVVTRYRQEARNFHYEADEVNAAYVGAITLRIDLGEGVQPLVIHTERQEAKRGIAHDVTFGPAGVMPERPVLLSQPQFFDEEKTRFVGQLATGMSQHFARSFCTAHAYTLEEASRCAYGQGQLPPEVATVFMSVMGNDGRLLPNILPHGSGP